jgi:hypothetical protein
LEKNNICDGIDRRNWKKNKISIKGSGIEIWNKKNNDWSWNTNNKEDQTVLFKRVEREKI